MEPRQSDPALSDPLFAELRRRHPDVDIVMLPPAPALAPEVPVATEGQLRALTRHVEAVLSAVGERVGVEPRVSVRFWHEQATPLLRTWIVKALLPLDPESASEEAVDLLRRVGDTLLELGWSARAATDPPRLRATAGPVELSATTGPMGVALEVETQPQHAAPATFTAVRHEVA